jgi:hypothetical protein
MIAINASTVKAASHVPAASKPLAQPWQRIFVTAVGIDPPANGDEQDAFGGVETSRVIGVSAEAEG